MSIDYRQLGFIVAAADTASFLRAAKQLNFKQSPLSKKVSAIEHRLGITLFLRSTPLHGPLQGVSAEGVAGDSESGSGSGEGLPLE